MNKRTLDSDGKESLLENDSCKVSVCEDGRENGPIFIIEQNTTKALQVFRICITKMVIQPTDLFHQKIKTH